MAFLLILLVVPIGLYSVFGRGRGRVWGLLPAGEVLRGGGAYRQAP